MSHGGSSGGEGGSNMALQAMQFAEEEDLRASGVVSRAEALHAGYSDAPGAGDAERRSRLAGLGTFSAVVYGLFVAFLIAGLNLPIGWTWLAAGIVALLCFLIGRATLT